MIDRNSAQQLIQEHCDFSLQRHLAHVAQAMEAMCLYFEEASNIDRWYIVGLLHDIDWNKTINEPQKHCSNESLSFLLDHGVDADWIKDIQSHCDWGNVERDTKLRKSLAAVDELSGFCVAVALMRPTKMVGMKAKSVMKKMKDKQFAKNVKREDMKVCEDYFGIKVSDLLDNTLLPAYQKIAGIWQLN